MESKENADAPRGDQQSSERPSGSEDQDETFPSQSNSRSLKSDLVKRVISMKQKASKQVKELQNQIPILVAGKGRKEEDISQESIQRPPQDGGTEDSELALNDTWPASLSVEEKSPASAARFTRSPIFVPVAAPPRSPRISRELGKIPVAIKNIELPLVSRETPLSQHSYPFPGAQASAVFMDDHETRDRLDTEPSSTSQSHAASEDTKPATESAKFMVHTPIPYSDVTSSVCTGGNLYSHIPTEFEYQAASASPAYEIQHQASTEHHNQELAPVRRLQSYVPRAVSPSSPKVRTSLSPSTDSRKSYSHGTISNVREDNDATISSKENAGVNAYSRRHADISTPFTYLGRVDNDEMYNLRVSSPSPPSVPDAVSDVQFEQSRLTSRRHSVYRPAPPPPPYLHATINQSPGPLRGYTPPPMPNYGFHLPPPLPPPPHALLHGYGATRPYQGPPPLVQPQTSRVTPSAPVDKEQEPTTPNLYRETSETSGSKLLRGWSNVTSYVRMKSEQILDGVNRKLSSSTSQTLDPPASYTAYEHDHRPPYRRPSQEQQQPGQPFLLGYPMEYERILWDMTCCCCWPVGLASRIVSRINPQGRGPVDSCVQAMSSQLSTCALLLGISFYFMIGLLLLLLVSVTAVRT